MGNVTQEFLSSIWHIAEAMALLLPSLLLYNGTEYLVHDERRTAKFMTWTTILIFVTYKYSHLKNQQVNRYWLSHLFNYIILGSL